MQPLTVFTVKSPSEYIQNSSFLKLLRLFKFELLKVIVFLVLFAATVIVANTESKDYYYNHGSETLDK